MEDIAQAESEQVKNISPMELKFTDVDKLSLFVTDTGKILSRKFTNLSAQHQRHITKMIKRARNMLLMK